MKKTILSLALVLASSSLAFGSIVITEGINNSAVRSAVVFSGAGTSIIDPVIGRTADNFFVTFDSTKVLEATASTATVSGTNDEDFIDLTFFSVGNFFTSLDFVLDVAKHRGNDKTQQITFTVDYIQGLQPHSETFTYDSNGNIDYPFTIEASAGEKISKVAFVAPGKVTSLYDLRIGGLKSLQQNDSPAVPEPLSMSMLGSGLLGLAFYARKRRVR